MKKIINADVQQGLGYAGKVTLNLKLEDYRIKRKNENNIIK